MLDMIQLALSTATLFGLGALWLDLRRGRPPKPRKQPVRGNAALKLTNL